MVPAKQKSGTIYGEAACVLSRVVIDEQPEDGQFHITEERCWIRHHYTASHTSKTNGIKNLSSFWGEKFLRKSEALCLGTTGWVPPNIHTKVAGKACITHPLPVFQCLPQKLLDDPLQPAHVAHLEHEVPQLEVALEPQSIVLVFPAK